MFIKIFKQMKTLKLKVLISCNRPSSFNLIYLMWVNLDYFCLLIKAILEQLIYKSDNTYFKIP